MWYEDDGCTETVGLAPFITGDNYELPLLDGVTCSDAMACVYNPDGDTCKGRGGDASGIATFQFTTSPDFVSSCDGTLSDIEGGSCVEETPDQCIPSGVFTGTDCYFRIVPAAFLARNPGYLVGEIEAGDGQEDMDTSGALGHGSSHLCVWAIATILVAIIGASCRVNSCFCVFIKLNHGMHSALGSITHHITQASDRDLLQHLLHACSRSSAASPVHL